MFVSLIKSCELSLTVLADRNKKCYKKVYRVNKEK